MNITEFQTLNSTKVTQIVQDHGIQVCGFTFNGTRRWFKFEYPTQRHDLRAYIQALSTRVIEVCQMLFDHGINTLVLPVISPHVLNKRDEAYRQMATQALMLLVADPRFLQFYEQYNVGVRIYGDYESYLEEETAVNLSQHLATLNQTPTTRRIFWGICAHDATETITNLTIQHFQEHGQAPTKADLIKKYYGDDIAALDLYIGSSKTQAIDMPLISSGRESLYFTVAPSPYFNQQQLRDILYDHIINRREHRDHVSVTPQQEAEMRQFYLANQHHTLGVGIRNTEWDVWHPLPQVELPQPTLVQTQLVTSRRADLLRKMWHNSLKASFFAFDKTITA